MLRPDHIQAQRQPVNYQSRRRRCPPRTREPPENNGQPRESARFRPQIAFIQVGRKRHYAGGVFGGEGGIRSRDSRSHQRLRPDPKPSIHQIHSKPEYQAQNRYSAIVAPHTLNAGGSSNLTSLCDGAGSASRGGPGPSHWPCAGSHTLVVPELPVSRPPRSEAQVQTEVLLKAEGRSFVVQRRLRPNPAPATRYRFDP